MVPVFILSLKLRKHGAFMKLEGMEVRGVGSIICTEGCHGNQGEAFSDAAS
jgi:hypothetical protein